MRNQVSVWKAESLIVAGMFIGWALMVCVGWMISPIVGNESAKQADWLMPWHWHIWTEVTAAWAQFLGAMLALALTMTISRSESRRLAREREGDKRRAASGFIMSLLIASHQAKFSLGRAIAVLNQIKKLDEANEIRESVMSIPFEAPSQIDAALRSASVFTDNFVSAVIEFAQAVAIASESTSVFAAGFREFSTAEVKKILRGDCPGTTISALVDPTLMVNIQAERAVERFEEIAQQELTHLANVGWKKGLIREMLQKVSAGDQP